MKICTLCNTEKAIEEFLRDKSARGGYRNQCKLCLMSRTKGTWDRRKEGYNSAMRRFRLTWKGVTQTSLTAAKGRSKKLEIPFDLDLQYLRDLLHSQDYKCNLTGKPMMPKGGWDSPSLDKIKPELGYVKGNVQWLSQRVNLMKSNLNLEEFLQICKECLERSETIRKEYTSSEVEAPGPQ